MGKTSIFPFKVYSFRGIILEWGIEIECADSVNVAKPQIEALLKTDRSYYYTGGERGRGVSDNTEAVSLSNAIIL